MALRWDALAIKLITKNRNFPFLGMCIPTMISYLEMDNCFRDFKNIYIFGFRAFFAKMGVFRKVQYIYVYAITRTFFVWYLLYRYKEL